MSDKTNERLEHEAREALVAAELSAKMKQWRDQPPPGKGRGNNGKPLLLILLLLLATGVTWWFWPKDAAQPLQPTEQLEIPPVPVPRESAPVLPQQQPETPTVPQPAGNKYAALLQSSYRAPDFASDIRGDASTDQDALNKARQALVDKRPADALALLKNDPPAYQTDANYLRAHALLSLKKYTQAAGFFGQLSGSIRYAEAAEWYGTLALLPEFDRNKDLIMSRLKEMAADDEHTFQREARQLLDKL